MYKLKRTMITQEIAFIEKDDGTNQVIVFPIDQSNTDYQQYQNWVAEGNTPLPADEVQA